MEEVKIIQIVPIVVTTDGKEVTIVYGLDNQSNVYVRDEFSHEWVLI